MPISGSKKKLRDESGGLFQDFWFELIMPISFLKSMLFLFTVLLEFQLQSSRVPQRLRIPVDSLRVCPTSDWRFWRSRSTTRCSLSSDKASNFVDGVPKSFRHACSKHSVLGSAAQISRRRAAQPFSPARVLVCKFSTFVPTSSFVTPVASVDLR